MRKKSSTSLLGLLYDVVALLPRWLGVMLAILSYVLLHSLVGLTPVSAGTTEAGAMLASSLARSFAVVFQYIVPVIFLAAAATSAWRRRQRNQLLEGVLQSDVQQAIQRLGWQQFELLVGEAFRRKGYAVTETGLGGADGGVDLVLSRGGERVLVQCKQWRANKVSVNVVRELLGVMLAKSATGGIVVTAGAFTADAKAFAQGRNIELIDGEALLALLGGQSALTTCVTERFAMNCCPKCGADMVKRMARQGAHAGQTFWGCSKYPACRGARAVV